MTTERGGSGGPSGPGKRSCFQQNRRPEEAGRTLLLDTLEESQPYGQLSLRLLAFRLRKRVWVLF